MKRHLFFDAGRLSKKGEQEMDVVYLLTDDKWDGNDLRHRFIYHDQIIAA